MNTKQLRQKILDLAIKGKLVPQDPNDEPASKLLERIREEKEQLIKEGKLKRDKNESYIFVGDDKLHYEKFADGSVICIEDEIPFEIPETWVWERLQNVCTLLTDGTHQTPSYMDMGHIFLSSKNVTTNKINWDDVMYIPNDLHEKLYKRLAPELNDILLAKNGTIGKAALVDRDIEFDVYVTLAVIRLFKKHISPQYIHKIIESKYVQDFFKGEQKGIGVPNLHLENIRKTLIPLPPSSEQQRISETVETLLQLVETIDSDKIDLSNLIKQTKAKVLDLAIKGKLVPQDPNDETADILLEKIREEKEKLIKGGKLKRDKNETYIFKNSDDNSYYEQIDGETICIDDDLPFEIPNSWRWVRLKNIAANQANAFVDGPFGSDLKVEHYTENREVRLIQLNNIGDGFWKDEGKKYTTFKHAEELLRCKTIPSDIVIAKMMPAGRCMIVPDKEEQYIISSDCVKLSTNNDINKNYIVNMINSPIIRKIIQDNTQGIGRSRTSLGKLKELLMPLPPLKEQKRITTKIKSIFAQLDSMQEIFLQ